MNDVEIRRVTLFSGDGFGRAGVTFRMGPVLVRGAKIFEKEGNRWLSMPGRKNGNGEWIDTVFIEDREARDRLEHMVLREYDRQMNAPQEEFEDARAMNQESV
jgi:DNA-binding cell septation regulator SpoVG